MLNKYFILLMISSITFNTSRYILLTGDHLSYTIRVITKIVEHASASCALAIAVLVNLKNLFLLIKLQDDIYNAELSSIDKFDQMHHIFETKIRYIIITYCILIVILFDADSILEYTHVLFQKIVQSFLN